MELRSTMTDDRVVSDRKILERANTISPFLCNIDEDAMAFVVVLLKADCERLNVIRFACHICIPTECMHLR